MRPWSWAALAVLVFVLSPLVARADVTGVVRGNVSLNGTARAGARVTLSGESTSNSTQTDAAGNFTFPLVPFGRYTVTAHVEGYPDASNSVTVTSDSVVTVSLPLGQVPEIGRASSQASGRSVAGNPVSVNTLSKSTIAALPQNQSLNLLVETVPGIVRFSYDEPVARGFHGVLYEVDGAPIPQTTASAFSEIIDPRNIDSLEIFTGAYPAEYGGQRMGAVVNIITKRDVDIPGGSYTEITPGAGSFDQTSLSLEQESRLGTTALFFNGNVQQNTRGLDPPTQDPLHDNTSLSDGFLRTITKLSSQDTLAFDYSSQYNTFQVPINTTITPYDLVVSLPNQDDVQREYNTFGNLNYTHTAPDGNSYFQVIPWWRTTRIVYAGDLAADVQALDYSNLTCGPDGMEPCPLAGLSQDRRASVVGLRAVYALLAGKNALKFGLDGSVENFISAEEIAQSGMPAFYDNVAQRGTTLSGYAEDKWTPSQIFSLSAGVRYDYSDGFVEGNQVEPRIGFNLGLGPTTVFHAYYGRLYAAPDLEDTRRAAVLIGGGSPSSSLPVYDLKPETDSYYEAGVAQTFGDGLSGYVTAWERNAWNVLDTTQIYPTPIFAVYNNSIGLAHGYDLRLDQRGATEDWYLSAEWSLSVASGISGGTFIFCPPGTSNQSSCLSSLGTLDLEPEDHDQTVSLNGGYTKHFGDRLRDYVTLGPEYGTGYPVCFQAGGCGRLTPHLTFNASIGRAPAPHSVGFSLQALNLANYQYLVKVNNGFNTTQWAAGLQLLFQLNLAF